MVVYNFMLLLIFLVLVDLLLLFINFGIFVSNIFLELLIGLH